MAVFNSRQRGSLTCNWGISLLGWPIWWKAAGRKLCGVNLTDLGVNSSCVVYTGVLCIRPFSLTVSSSLNHSLVCSLTQAVTLPAGWPWPLHHLSQCVMCVHSHISAFWMQLCYICFDHNNTALGQLRRLSSTSMFVCVSPSSPKGKWPTNTKKTTNTTLWKYAMKQNMNWNISQSYHKL